jgi:hypothetical protein
MLTHYPARFMALKNTPHRSAGFLAPRFFRIDVCLAREQPIHGLAKLLTDCQQHCCTSFLFSAFER